jgi:hypothetical protein
MARLLALSLLPLLAAPETTSGASAPAPQPKTSTPPAKATPTPSPASTPSPTPRGTVGGTDSKGTESPSASASPAATPASPEAPEGDKPRRGRPPGSGTATASAPKVETPPSEMGMGALLKEAVKASGVVERRTAELVEASKALGVVVTEMQKRLQ